MSLLWVALKDLRLVVRDRAALLFLIVVPLVVITIIAETQGRQDSGNIRLLVLNEDRGPVAEALLLSLRKHVEVVEVPADRAEQMVGRENRAPALLVLPRGLSKSYLAGVPTSVGLVTDPVRRTEIETVKALLLLAEKEASSLADPFYEDLLRLDERNATGSRLSIPPFELFVPGFSLMFVLMGVFFGLALGLRDEQDWGGLTRLRLAPIPRWSYLVGKLSARFAVGVAQLALLFVYGHLVYGIAVGRSLPALLLLLLAIVFAMTGFSLLVAGFARSREQIVPLGMTVVMIVCALGGCWWPIYDEPPWLQQIAHGMFTTWAMEGIHDLVLRERGLLEVAPTLGVLLAYGAICLGLGVLLQRRADRAQSPL